MKTLFPVQLFAFALVALMAQQSLAGRDDQRRSLDGLPKLLLGVYQPDSAVQPLTGLNASHAFFPLASPDSPSRLRAFLLQSSAVRTLPMVTLEPFPASDRPQGGNQLLKDMQAGVYNGRIDSIALVLKQSKRPVLLRFAHEMDAEGLYPWSYVDGRQYVALYGYVRRRTLASGASNILWVWSPQGRKNSDRFWPGRSQVDLIGVSIYASKAFSTDRQLLSFQSLLDQRLWLSKRFGKPIIAAEVGVSGDAREQQLWIGSALSSMGQFPDLRGFFYYQAQQPAFMPLASGHEDWRLPPAALSMLGSRAMEVTR
jgi:cellulose synthase (UDP-forming)